MLKRSLLFMLFVALLAPWTANAQTTDCAAIGESSTSYGAGGYSGAGYMPIDIYYKYSYEQIVYDGSEMPTTITSISFKYKSDYALTQKSNVDIYLGETTTATLSSWMPASDLTLVYSGAMDFPASSTGEWVEFTFNQNEGSYSHDQSKYIVVVVNDKSNGYPSSNYSSMYFCYQSCASGAHKYVRTDSNAYTVPPTNTANDAMQYPVVRFCGTFPAVSCAKPSGLTATLTQGDGSVATLSWTEKGEATNWVLQTATNDGFTEDLHEYEVSGTPSKNLTGLTAEEKLYARVKAVCDPSNPGDNDSDWSGIIEFTPTNSIVIGTGSEESGYAPLVTNYKKSYDQMIYTAEQLNFSTPMVINKIGFNSKSANTIQRTITIYMGHTTKNSFSGSTDFVSIDDLTPVYSNHTWNIAAGWNEFVLDEPFDYDGTSNLIVAMYSTATSYNGTSFYCTTTSSNQLVYARDDTADPNPYTNEGSWSGYGGYCYNDTKLPNLKMLASPNLTPKPKDLTVGDDISSSGVTMSWTAPVTESPIVCYLANYKKVADAYWSSEISVVGATSTPLSGLDPQTEYEFRVKADYGTLGQSDYISTTFTTLSSCATPFNLAAANETAHGATLTWSGNSDSYKVYVGEVLENVAFSANFEGGTLPSEITTTTSYPWTVVANDHSGAYCAKSSNEDEDNSISDMVLEVIVTETSQLTFSAKVSSEGGWDKAYFSIDGTTQTDLNGISGNGNWIDYSYTLAPGKYTLRWWYEKDSGTANYDDCFYVDDIKVAYSYVDSWIVYNAPASPFELYDATDIHAETEYQVKVIGVCGSIETDPSEIINFTTIASCPAPTDLANGTPGINSVELSWTENGSAAKWQICINNDLEHLKLVSENPFTLDGLTGNTHYSVKVRAYCDVTDQSIWSNTVSFDTDCDAYPIPYSFGFELAEINDMNCWTIYDEPGRTGILTSTSTIGDMAHSGDYYFAFSYYDYPDTDPQYMTLVSPELSGITATGLHVEFYYVVDPAYKETFRVGYSTTTKELSNFVWDNAISTKSGEYKLFTGNYPAGTKYIAVQHLSDDADYLLLDDFSFTAAPSCREPKNPQVTNIAATEAYLSWTPGGEETAWDIYVTDDVADVPNGSTTPTDANITSNTDYPIDGLTAGTTYYMYLRSACDATEHSEWTLPTSFNTECEALPLPYSYDFEDDELPVCWKTITSDSGWNIFVISTSEPQQGNKHLNLSCSSSGYQYVALTEFDANYPVNEYEVTFYAKLAGTYTTGRSLAVGVMTDPEDEETFVQIGNAFTPTTTYAKYKVRLNTYTGSGQYIAIKHTISNTGNTFIDHLEVNPVSLCYEPSGLTCTATTGSTATFSWTAGNDGDNPQSAWQLYISTSNVAPADDIDEKWLIQANENPYTVTSGLTAETVHYVWVRGNCSANSHGYSDWVGGISFTPSNYKDHTYNNNPSSSNGNIPFYGSYVNTATKSQYIIPATDLPDEMLDGSVRRLTYYTSATASANWGTAEFDIYVAEVENNVFATAEFVDWDDLTKVYHGSLTLSNYKLEIDLDDEFVYHGGNLLIGFDLTTTGTNYYISWRSSSTSGVYHGVYQYGTNSPSRSTYNPMITFNYRPSDTPRPLDLHTVQVLSTQATLAWTAQSENATGYEYQYKLSSSSEWSTPEVVTGTTATVPGLTPESDYDFRVRAIYAGPTYSQYVEVSFPTPAACTVPTDLAESNLTMVSADMSWTVSPEVSGYTLQYRTAAGYDVDYTEDFSGVEPVAYSTTPYYLPEGWKSYNTNGNAPRVSNKAKCSDINEFGDGVNYLLLTTNNCSSDSTYAYAIMPEISNLISLQFKYVYESTSSGSKLTIGYVTNNSDYTTYHMLRTATPNGSIQTCTLTDDDIATINANNGYVTFCHSRKGSTYYSVGVNDIVILAGTDNPLGAWIDATTDNTTGKVTLTGLTAGKKYDVRVYPNCATDPDSDNDMVTFNTLAQGKVFMKAGNWGTASNWVPSGAPELTDIAIIRANATIETNCVAKANLIEFEGTTTPTLTIADGGQLQTNANVTATVKKSIEHYTIETTSGEQKANGYYLVSSPVTNMYNPINCGMVTTSDYDLYKWEYTNSATEWINYEAQVFSISNGTGYLYANAADVELTFTGTVKANNTDVTKNLGYATSSAASSLTWNGWNLVANPFMCNAYITPIGGTTENPIAYYRMNADRNDLETSTDPITPMEGIFVQATTTEQSIKFSRKEPEKVPGNGKLNINLAQAVTSRGAKGDTDKAIVRFDGGNNLGKFSFRDNTPKVYIPQDGKDYAVVNAQTQGELPVNFKAAENGNYTLSFTTEDVEFSYLHLIDNLTGNDVDLLVTPSYSFDAQNTDFAARFKLVFAKGNGNMGDDFGFIDANGNLLILGIDGTATLQVVDVTGRVLSSETFSGNYSKPVKAAAGVYMLRLIQGNDSRTQKIVVK